MTDLWNKASSTLRPHPAFAGDPSATHSLLDRMRLHNVSAVSIAIVHQGKLEVDTAVGQLAADDPTPATSETVFGACSISKAVTSMAVLRLVAASKLPLDADVNDHIRDWRLTDASGRSVKVTLRQLLTHTAGVNIHGADGYDPVGAIPTLEQIFRGQPPAMSANPRRRRSGLALRVFLRWIHRAAEAHLRHHRSGVRRRHAHAGLRPAGDEAQHISLRCRGDAARVPRTSR